MGDEDALLAAIIAHTDEDTPRLAYADWLQEHGDEDRAEFIRLQCRNAVRDPGEVDPADEEREAVLEDENRGKWLAGLPQFAGVMWEFRQGFPEVLTVDGEFLLERYRAFARVPWVRRLCVPGAVNWVLRDLASRNWNPHWVELELYLYGSDPDYTPGIVSFARCPQVRQLRSLRLDVFQWWLTPEAVVELAESPHLDQLQELRIAGAMNTPALGPLRERFGERLITEQSF